jgi:hypothetical protein
MAVFDFAVAGGGRAARRSRAGCWPNFGLSGRFLKVRVAYFSLRRGSSLATHMKTGRGPYLPVFRARVSSLYFHS